MISQVIADVEALEVAVLAELVEEVLVEVFEVVLDVARVEIGLSLGVQRRGWGEHVRALVHVGEKERWADCGLGVEPRAPVTVPAGSDLEIERAVHPVFLSSEYRRQVLRHIWFWILDLRSVSVCVCVCLIIDLTLIIRAVIESASNSKSIPFGLWVCFALLFVSLL